MRHAYQSLGLICYKDYPAAVLIRGGIDYDMSMPVNGPARLTKNLKITGALNGRKLGKASGLWIEARTPEMTALLKDPHAIKKTPRIGVDYAGPVWSKKKWRFVLCAPRRVKLEPDYL